MAKILSETLVKPQILDENAPRSLKKIRKTPPQTALDKKALSKAVLAAAHRAGKQFGEDGLISYLEAQALATPSPFISLLAKAICEADEECASPITKIEIVGVDKKTCLAKK